jgi:hypothetical protein
MCEAIKPKVKKTESITKGLIGTCYFAHNFFMILHPHIGESHFYNLQAMQISSGKNKLSKFHTQIYMKVETTLMHMFATHEEVVQSCLL